MSNPRDIALPLDIVAACERIAEFTQGMDETRFRQDARTHLAVQHQIMVIGEAAKRLSKDSRISIQEVSWPAVARMRDRLIHGYATVDLSVVWDTVQLSLPEMLMGIRAFLDTHNDENLS